MENLLGQPASPTVGFEYAETDFIEIRQDERLNNNFTGKISTILADNHSLWAVESIRKATQCLVQKTDFTYLQNVFFKISF